MFTTERVLHVVTGEMRACTTIFANMITDNPSMRVSSTSMMADMCHEIKVRWSQSIDLREMLLRDPTGEEAKATLRAMMRGFIEARHPLMDEEKIVWDKGRGWMLKFDLLRAIYPNTRMIVMVRHLLDIIASCERPFRDNALWTDGRPETLEDRVSVYLKMTPSNQPGEPGVGMIGGPLIGIKDLLLRGDGTLLNLKNPDPDPHEHILFVKAEDLQSNAMDTMKAVYAFLGIDYWHPPHSYENVGRHATDPDPLLLNMFSHNAGGKVHLPKEEGWRDMMIQRVADEVMGSPDLHWYHKAFGYLPDGGEDGGDSLLSERSERGSTVVKKKARTRRRNRKR